MIARITHLPDGSVELTFPFNRDLVEAFKARIPTYYRGYNPASKTWTVAGVLDWPVFAAGLLRQFFPGAEEINAPRRPEPEPIRRADPDFATLHLLPSAPAELIEAAFRCLARRHHPDRGGDHAAMLRLNGAVARLRARVAS